MTSLRFLDPVEVARELREQREKGLILHTERGKAWREMIDAQTQHRFLVDACRASEERESELRGHLRSLLERQAMEMAT